MEKNLKNFKWETILAALMYVIVGALLVIFPTAIAKSLCYTIAIIVIAIGVIKLISFLIKKEQDGFVRTGLVSGIIFILIGVFIAVKSSVIISIIPFVLGILIAVSGFTKLQNVIQLKKLGENSKGMLVMALINIVIGLCLAFNPFRAAKWMIVLIGICVLLTGLSDLFSAVYVYRKIKAHKDEMDVLDQEYKEVK